MAGAWDETEMDALRGAIKHLDSLVSIAEEWKGWGLPTEALEETRHTMTARFGALALDLEANTKGGHAG